MQAIITLQAFIVADLNRKDRKAQHNNRLTVVGAAIDAALRGNRTQYISAQVPAEAGKGKLAQAYKSAFAAVPAPAKYDYAGKLTPQVAKQIAQETARLVAKWSDAFTAVFPLEVAEQSEADKADKAAKRKAEAEAEAIKLAESLGYVKPVKLTPAAQADAIIAIVRSGELTGENLAAVAMVINAAVAADTEAREAVKSASKSGKARAALVGA